MTEAERKLALANKAWTAKSKQKKDKPSEASEKAKEEAKEFLIQKSDPQSESPNNSIN